MSNCVQFNNEQGKRPCKTLTVPDLKNVDFDPKNLAKILAKTYKKDKYTSDYKNKDIHELCGQSNFTLKKHQKFLAQVMTLPDFNGMLVYHGLGSGKTCASIVVAESLKHIGVDGSLVNRKVPGQIVVVIPKQLQRQYINEIKSRCTGEIILDGVKQEYVTPSQRARLSNKNTTNDQKTQIERTIRNKISQTYHIISHQSFANKLFTKEGNPGPTLKLVTKKNTLLIIDEIQSLISEEGSMYSKLLKAITYHSDDSLKTLLLSATPIFDKPFEIGLTLNLLKPRIPFPRTSDEFNKLFLTPNLRMKNQALFRSMCAGYVSYFKGGNPNAYPDYKVKVKDVMMSPYQTDVYMNALDNELERTIETMREQRTEESEFGKLNVPINLAFSNTMSFSNIAFPDRSCESKPNFKKPKERQGLNDLALCLGKFPKQEIVSNFATYSHKFSSILKKALESDGPVLIYSRLITYGILPIAEVLSLLGFSNFNTSQQTGENTFAIWSGDTEEDVSEKILKVFKSSSNVNGGQIKILLATSAISQGVSLHNIRQVHICEPWWNDARIQQVIFRAIRFCSHFDTVKLGRKPIVDVYIYRSTFSGTRKSVIENRKLTEKIMKKTKDVSRKEYFQKLNRDGIDISVYDTSERKLKVTREFEHALKQSAIDCILNKHGNVVKMFEYTGPDGKTIRRTDGSVSKNVKKNDIIKETISCNKVKKVPIPKSLKENAQKIQLAKKLFDLPENEFVKCVETMLKGKQLDDLTNEVRREKENTSTERKELLNILKKLTRGIDFVGIDLSFLTVDDLKRMIRAKTEPFPLLSDKRVFKPIETKQVDIKSGVYISDKVDYKIQLVFKENITIMNSLFPGKEFTFRPTSPNLFNYKNVNLRTTSSDDFYINNTRFYRKN